MADARIREIQPGGTITVQALGFPTGQTPSLRVILLTTGAVAIASSSAGITEDSPGNYDKQLAIPTSLVAGDYAAEWQFSGVWYRDEDIVRVTGSPLPAPGAYTTVDDLRDALAPEGADQATAASTAAQLGDAQLADAIAEAQQEVDARLSDRYDTPFDTPPPLVGQLTRDIAAYRATLTHRRQAPLAEDHPVRLRYNDARELLKLVKLGHVDVSDDEALSVEPTVVNVIPEGNLFVPGNFGIETYYQN